MIATIIDQKKIPLSKLLHQEYSLPVDRIIRFLKLLKRNLINKKVVGNVSQVENFYLQEAQYALQKINKREMFTATNELIKLVRQ